MAAVQNNPTPSMPSKLEVEALISPEPSLYVMIYRHGMNAKLEKIFKHDGDLYSARKRAQAHSEIMGYKLTWVRPLVIDLDSEEAQQQGKMVNG